MRKSDFPIYQHHKNLVYLDTAASSQKPDMVLKSMNDFYEEKYANPSRGVYPLAAEATQAYENARVRVARFINAESKEQVIFTKSTTESLNIVSFLLAKTLTKEKGVLVTRAEHHANFLPWQRICQEKKAPFSILESDEQGVLPSEISPFLQKAKVFSHALCTNVTGERMPSERWLKEAKKEGLITVLDAAQAVVHEKIDVQDLGCDFLAFSSHKLYGPMGLGVLYVGKEHLSLLEPFILGGGMVSQVRDEDFQALPLPDLMEAGTQNVAAAVGLSSAMDYIASIGYQKIADHESHLSQKLYQGLKPWIDAQKIRLVGKDEARAMGLYAFSPLQGAHAHDLATFLGAKNICVRAGHHCAMPLQRRLGSCITIRVSLGLYNDEKDIEHFFSAFEEGMKFLEN